MSEYPEHIDQIDDFYRSQLADHEIEPPEGLWGKISLGALETPSPEVKAATGFTNTQKYLGLLAGSIILVTATFYLYNRKQDTSASHQDSIPAIEQPIDKSNNAPSSETESISSPGIAPSKQLKENTTLPSSDNTKTKESVNTPDVIENHNNESKTEQQPIINAPVEEPKVDSVAEIKTTQKTPKEKVKFKDKYKKDYQDSTRKIFVPGK